MARRKNMEKKESVSKETAEKINKDDESDEDPDLSELMDGSSLMVEDEDFEEDEVLGEIDEEDEEKEVLKEFKDDVIKKELKILSVFEKIALTKYPDVNNIKPDEAKEEYDKLIAMLDEHNIIVHFKNDYSAKEKYRFVTEEVFKQDIEDFKKSKVHINFIYEDFHPEMDEDDDDEDFY